MLVGDVGPVLGDEPSFVEDEDPIREREDLVELERDEQDGPALVPLLDEPPVHELDRSDVQAPRRLCGDEHARVTRDLPGDHQLLLVPAGERGGKRLRAAAANVELLQQTPSAAEEPLGKKPAELGVGLSTVVVEREVLRQIEVEDEPVPVPVLGDVPLARVEGAPCAAPGDVLAGDDNPPGGGPPQPRERVDELALAVPVDAGDADDLPGPDVE